MVKCNQSTCRSLILIFIDFVCKIFKNYYTSVYLMMMFDVSLSTHTPVDSALRVVV